MPNHVETTITIIGPAEALDQIAALAEAEQSILEHFLPLPEGATEVRTGVTADGTPWEYSVFTDNGYAMACKLWGSKWADYDVRLEDDGRTEPTPSITVCCSSAWSPNVEGYRKLSTMLGIAAVLSYKDEGWGFVGASAVVNGEIVSEERFGTEALDGFANGKGVPSSPPEAKDGEDADEVRDEWWTEYDDACYEARLFCGEKVRDVLEGLLTA